MITPDGVGHGIHAFVVKIRELDTMLPPLGVSLGDVGEKIGLNGMDNGFIMFNRYSVPRDCLLNKYGDVTLEGEYITSIEDDNRRFGELSGIFCSSKFDTFIYRFQRLL